MKFLRPSCAKAGTALFALDAACLVVLWPLAIWYAWPGGALLDAPPVVIRALLYPAADLLVLYAMGLYRRDAIREPRKALVRIPLVVGMGAALAILASVTLPLLGMEALVGFAWRDQVLMLGLAGAAFTLAAYLARLVFAMLQRRRVLHRRLLVVGAGSRAYDLLMMLNKEGNNLHYDITFLPGSAPEEIDPRLAAHPAARILPAGDDDVLSAARLVEAGQIVIAPTERRGIDLRPLLDCKKAGFPVVQYLSFVEAEIRRVDLKRMELGWLVFSDGFTFSAIDRFLKRLFDLVVSSVVLLLTAPLLLCGLLAIRWEAPGPVFYRQERVTLDGRVFRILKLRTMRVDAEANGAVWAKTRDNRVTRVGSFLRRTRIDELPQLINILRGEMSFVGPRPERPMFVAELSKQIPLYQERHMVKAGLTGWAQVNYPYGASVDDARSKLSYDLYYVKNFSILFDFVILSQTLREVLWPSGVR